MKTLIILIRLLLAFIAVGIMLFLEYLNKKRIIEIIEKKEIRENMEKLNLV